MYCPVMNHWEARLKLTRKHYGLWHHPAIFALAFVALLLLTSDCQLAQSSFARTANNAGAAFAAASLTLNYVHEGKITYAYARSAFMNYQSELQGLDQQIPSQAGAPDMQNIRLLLDAYRPAIQVVNQPCLDASCNWHSQLASLDRASKAFLKAGGQ
jgi:hypothetical protein